MFLLRFLSSVARNILSRIEKRLEKMLEMMKFLILQIQIFSN